MAAYKKGTMSKSAGVSAIDRENISNTNLKNRFEEIHKSYLDKGYTPTSFSPLDISEGMLPTYTKTTISPAGSFATGGQVGQSFNKMMGGGVTRGGEFPSMGDLEAASMRLADAASNRRIGETEKEYGLKGGLLGQEYGLRDVSTAKEYGLKGGLLGQEYGLKGGLLGQEYGLRGNLAQRESDVAASSAALAGGYSSTEQMQRDLQRQRQQTEKREIEAERMQKEQRPYTIDRRGRRVYS